MGNKTKNIETKKTIKNKSIYVNAISYCLLYDD